jgi:probable rRNA maturation factor
LPVSIQNLQCRVPVSLPRLKAAARRTLSALGRADRDVHVTLVDDRAIRRLHGRYLGRRKATDVIAFHLEGPGPSRLLGEVVISAEMAARQARAVGAPAGLEMELLLVHGLLHLAGYDDHAPGEARLMHERAREILTRLQRRIPRGFWDGLLAGPGHGPARRPRPS